MGMGSLPALDIDLLRTFVLIAEGRSFTRAAERVGRTQSAVSLQVQRLESLVGQRLFDRTKGGGVELTAQGHYLLDRAREMTALNDDILAGVGVEPAATAEERGEPELVAPGRNVFGRPSIAVLPFRNLSGEAEQGYFADGVMDDIVAALARIRWLIVAASGAGAPYRNRAIDAREVGRALGVRYLLQGGVRKLANRLRISAELIEAETRKVLWADKYEGSLDDLFAFQDEIADQVAGTVEPNLRRSEIERSRRKRTESLDAYDLYLRALPHVAAQMPGEAKKALPLLQRALKLDPTYMAAHALIAWCHELCFARGGFDQSDRIAALFHARETLASDTDDGTSIAIAGFVISLLTNEHDSALSSIERGLAANPSCATALYLGAQAAGLAGRPATATSMANQALRLSRTDPLAFEAHLALGEAAIMEQRYADAAACFSRAAVAKPNFSTAYVFQGISLSLAGETEAARPVIRRAIELEPDFRFRLFQELGLAQPLVDALFEGASALGLPQ